MTSHLARLGLGVLAALTLFLSAGGALGLWHTGAPATGPGVVTAAGSPESSAAAKGPLRPAAAQWSNRVAEGSNGDIARGGPDATAPSPQAPQPSGAPRSDDPPVATPGSSATSKPAGPDEVALPPASGAGRRVVFDMSEQRVWLVGSAGNVQRTYLVSGSKHDNLDPGHYEVYSKSRHAVSYTYEETMRYMVRFAEGDTAAIGFHDIPRDQQGDPVQTRAQLGRRLSSGCIRQARDDAIALWRFADVGTAVVVSR
jgi:lipoprotein-anchoring transpeptidase ErfK/SrfK